VAEYSEQIKAQALAAMLAGQAPSDVARAFGIPVGTLHSWKSRQRHGESLASLASDSRARIGVLLLDYLQAALETLGRHQVAFRNEEWIHKQSAAEIAVLHRETLAGAIRLLEGLADQDDGSADA
jgi:transposase-like protein